LYKPAVSKAEYGKKSINHLVKGYFEGSPAKLLSHFVNENKLSQEDLEALLEQIKNAKNQNQ
jgi:predicted transcriptional regulator